MSKRHRDDLNPALMFGTALATSLVLTFSCGFFARPSTQGAKLTASSSLRLGPVDVLVFAPHPDDEVIGAAGVLRQALEIRKRVLVVFATNGDGYPLAASRLLHKAISSLVSADYMELAAARQREAITADGLLGMNASDLLFLGYPDGVLAGVYADTSGDPVRSPTTGRRATYGAIETDYHSLAHGRPAAYTREAALDDIAEILRQSQPKELYVTDSADQHPDHVATYDLVRDATAAVGFRGKLLTYVVHSGPGWPWPIGPTPASPFESRTILGTTYPIGVRWPPPIRVSLTEFESALKLEALQANHTQLGSSIDRLYLESFVKSEEIFWTPREY